MSCHHLTTLQLHPKSKRTPTGELPLPPPVAAPPAPTAPFLPTPAPAPPTAALIALVVLTAVRQPLQTHYGGVLAQQLDLEGLDLSGGRAQTRFVGCGGSFDWWWGFVDWWRGANGGGRQEGESVLTSSRLSNVHGSSAPINQRTADTWAHTHAPERRPPTPATPRSPPTPAPPAPPRPPPPHHRRPSCRRPQDSRRRRRCYYCHSSSRRSGRRSPHRRRAAAPGRSGRRRARPTRRGRRRWRPAAGGRGRRGRAMRRPARGRGPWWRARRTNKSLLVRAHARVGGWRRGERDICMRVVGAMQPGMHVAGFIVKAAGPQAS